MLVGVCPSSETRNFVNVVYVVGPKRTRNDCKGGYVNMLKKNLLIIIEWLCNDDFPQIYFAFVGSDSVAWGFLTIVYILHKKGLKGPHMNARGVGVREDDSIMLTQIRIMSKHTVLLIHFGKSFSCTKTCNFCIPVRFISKKLGYVHP